MVEAGGPLIVRVKSRIAAAAHGTRAVVRPAGRGVVGHPSEATRSWATTVAAPGDDGGPPGEIAGRVCVLRKSLEAIRLPRQKSAGTSGFSPFSIRPAPTLIPDRNAGLPELFAPTLPRNLYN